MATAEISNRLDEISVATGIKRFSLKRIFTHSNLQKNKKDVEVIDKHSVVKIPSVRYLLTANDLGPKDESFDKANTSASSSINIEVPKASHVAVLFSLSSLFSLERKVILVEEKIDPDDVATSPLHDSDDGSREVFFWSAPTENCLQEYVSFRCEDESIEVVELNNKSLIPLVTQNDSLASEDSSAGLIGETTTSRRSETVMESGKENLQDEKQNASLQCNAPEIAVRSNCSPRKTQSFSKILSKISKNFKRIIDKGKARAPTTKTICEDSSIEDKKENKVEITTILQSENCVEIEARRESWQVIEESPSSEATSAPDINSHSEASLKMSDDADQDLVDICLKSR